MEKLTELNSDLTTYPIAETFHSIQGEGAWTGVSAFFIRLAGCNVGCPWCDQK
ncbi:MAG: 7-carboxy-7-deazaguanine synthase QueE, partial [Candidatus Atelocyanobacterium sp. ALOHA_A2.5_9]|nr:7-carboxy-7-deazaguanine synthase QueE [Candidatus Atelocyanobacterium sp. ALOHA_A2.5_9]